jgi:hypothetical protein
LGPFIIAGNDLTMLLKSGVQKYKLFLYKKMEMAEKEAKELSLPLHCQKRFLNKF